jgi:hypothetical protein
MYIFVCGSYNNFSHVFACKSDIFYSSIPPLRYSFPRQALFHNQPRVVQPTMAPNLAPSKYELIYDMIHSGEPSINRMAEAACHNKRIISRISFNPKMFSSVKVPPITGGRPRNNTSVLLKALRDYQIEKPALCLDEIQKYCSRPW